MTIKPTNIGLVGRSFAVFINGYVNVNQTINFESFSALQDEQFTVSVVAQDIDLRNTAPQIDALLTNIDINLEKNSEEQVYSIGRPYDLQLDKFYVSEWGLVDGETPTWITFLNGTIIDGIYFKIKPTQEEVNQSFRVFFTLVDLNPSDPQTRTLEFTVNVSGPEEEVVVNTESDYEFVSDPTPTPKEEVVITIETPDVEGKFAIKASKKIRLPANYTSWTDENEGAEKIFVEYLPT